ncbi:DUF2628 domain-containing protein [Hyphomicrobium sp.]|uniref:DUF2628 domain-containing protein n=1 Tax=Hyphomicrobium sp. TaxID=82 RepID=UPI000F9D4630|nr:DUF2628 domain-containing protein [Hyphomicrobium sp.]RUP00182.1 MAG: DUF2628 domain-containing protein [Hyphomicrobium sp.]
MATYTVHEPPEADSDRVDRGVELEFVKDGFSWLTAICPPLGFIANGLWLMAIAYLAGTGLLAYLLQSLKVSPELSGILFLALNIYLGLEISTFKRWMLDQKGWQMLGVVNGRTMAECERRFFESWLPQQPVIASDERGQGMPPQRGSRFWPFGASA